MGDIFQEVDEEVRRDRFHKIWKEYGGYIIAAAVALVLVLDGVVEFIEFIRIQAPGQAQFRQAARAA